MTAPIRKDKNGKVIVIGNKLKGHGLTLNREVTGAVIALEAGGAGNLTVELAEPRQLPDGQMRDVLVWEYLTDTSSEVVG